MKTNCDYARIVLNIVFVQLIVTNMKFLAKIVTYIVINIFQFLIQICSCSFTDPIGICRPKAKENGKYSIQHNYSINSNFTQ